MSTILKQNPDQEIIYPTSDGQPMAETGIHVTAIRYLYDVLDRFLPSHFCLCNDQFWYWEEGNIRECCAPDVMVIPDLGRVPLPCLKSWEHGNPVFVFETASAGTWRIDLREKYRLFERLGVPEYFIFDPEGLYLRPQLMGFLLASNHYQRILPEDDESLLSEQLGLRILADGQIMRFFDAQSCAPILPSWELANQATELLEQERQKVAQEKQRAEQERQRAEQEKQRAEQEKQRAEQLQAELERLKSLLSRSGPNPGEATS